MINIFEVNETNTMIQQEKLDVRTITLGISLLDCCDTNLDELNRKIYEKITTVAKDLVKTGEQIELVPRTLAVTNQNQCFHFFFFFVVSLNFTFSPFGNGPCGNFSL